MTGEGALDEIEKRATEASADLAELRRIKREVSAEVEAGALDGDDANVEICRRLPERLGILIVEPEYVVGGRHEPMCARCACVVRSESMHNRWHLRLMAAVKVADVEAALAHETAFLLGALLAGALDIATGEDT